MTENEKRAIKLRVSRLLILYTLELQKKYHMLPTTLKDNEQRCKEEVVDYIRTHPYTMESVVGEIK